MKIMAQTLIEIIIQVLSVKLITWNLILIKTVCYINLYRNKRLLSKLCNVRYMGNIDTNHSRSHNMKHLKNLSDLFPNKPHGHQGQITYLYHSTYIFSVSKSTAELLLTPSGSILVNLTSTASHKFYKNYGLILQTFKKLSRVYLK